MRCAGCSPRRSRRTGPFSLRFPRGAAPSASSEPLEPVAVPSIVIRHRGQDLALFAVGKMVAVAMQAQEKLSALGISTTVVDARFVKPLAPELSAIAARHRAVVTVEDGVASGGFGSASPISSPRTASPCRSCGSAPRPFHRARRAGSAARTAGTRRGRHRRRRARAAARDRGARGLTGRTGERDTMNEVITP